MEKGMIRGMDVSSYLEMKDKGYRYFDETGEEVDVLEYAVKRGFNYARLRLWNEPQNEPESGGYCDLAQTIIIAKKIKALGMGFFLDFHYSDWWADPGHQKKPKAWENLSVDELCGAIYDFTKDCMEQLDQAGVYPDMIQIGNEIRTGMLFPDGAVPNWDNLARFVNAGIRAVLDTKGTHQIRIVLHLDQGGKYEYYREWFDQMMARGVKDFDIIGLSYYPFWHGTFSMFKQTMDALADRYHKDLVVAETAHAFRKSGGSFFREEQERAAGFRATPENQKKVLELIISIIAGTKDQRGLGFFYWEPFSRAPEDADGWGVCMGLMDEKGMPTKGFDAISFVPEECNAKKIAKIDCPEELVLWQDEICFEERLEDASIKNLLKKLLKNLPQQIEVLHMDGTVSWENVHWILNIVDNGNVIENEAGNTLKECHALLENVVEERHTLLENTAKECYTLLESAGKPDPLQIFVAEGVVENVPAEWANVSMRVFVEQTPENILKNGDFEDGMKDIFIRCSSGVSYGTDDDGFYFTSMENFTLELSMQAEVTPGDAYQAYFTYCGGNTTGTQVRFFVRDKEEEYICEVFPREAQFDRYSIEIPEAVSDSLTVGVKIEAPPVSGRIKSFILCRK